MLSIVSVLFCLRQFSLSLLPRALFQLHFIGQRRLPSMSVCLSVCTLLPPIEVLSFVKLALCCLEKKAASIYEQLLHASMYGLADSSSKNLRGSCLYSGKNSELSQLRKFAAARWDISSIHRKYIYLLCSISSVAECESWESNTFNLFDSRL